VTGYSALMAGAVLTVAGFALTTCVIHAETVSLSGTPVTLRETQAPGALAEVHMHNRTVNGPQDQHSFTLTLGDITVGARFDWNHTGDDDAVIVTPPDGLFCDPADCVLVVPEDAEGVLLIYATESVGF
jgi:hypothetical protein